MQAVSANLLNPYLKATLSVLQIMLGETPTKSAPFAERLRKTSDQLNICIGVTGDATGHVILGMSLQTATRIARQMIGSHQKTFDRFAESAIGELGNMICGNALSDISAAGYSCDITPPTILRGLNIDITFPSMPAIVVPCELSLGTVNLTLALVARKAEAAA